MSTVTRRRPLPTVSQQSDEPVVPVRIRYLRKHGVTYWDNRTKTMVTRTFDS